MKWTDVREIAIQLADSRPQEDPMRVRFVDLMQWVMELPGFADKAERCNEKILEAIQMAWMEER
ncbi:MAG: Fe-S cluster assembly protein IscX [Magnetococcales bacterium]|nr:Fe-S cluster assembly protein IscX [Magnetococcales bacterium]NGZ28335.1 Fe-S cluster assembly protein IscX [Magnetococcales bacterium]